MTPPPRLRSPSYIYSDPGSVPIKPGRTQLGGCVGAFLRARRACVTPAGASPPIRRARAEAQRRGRRGGHNTPFILLESRGHPESGGGIRIRPQHPVPLSPALCPGGAAASPGAGPLRGAAGRPRPASSGALGPRCPAPTAGGPLLASPSVGAELLGAPRQRGASPSAACVPSAASPSTASRLCAAAPSAASPPSSTSPWALARRGSRALPGWRPPRDLSAPSLRSPCSREPRACPLPPPEVQVAPLGARVASMGP